jgi:hypothetical protein
MAIKPSRELPQPKPKVSNMGRAAIGKTAPNTDLTTALDASAEAEYISKLSTKYICSDCSLC